MKIAIRQSQKINLRIHNSRITIRQRIAQLGSKHTPGIVVQYYEELPLHFSNGPALVSLEISSA